VTTTQLDVRPLTGAIGAEIFGVDLGADLDDTTIAAIRRALLDHCVVFFRDQDITDDQQVRFATRFSGVQRAVFGNTSDVAPDLTVIDMLTPKGSGTDVWHADSTFMPAPPFGAVLRAVQIPEVGGDTCFASMYAAYDALSPSMQQQLDGLTAVHSTAHVMELVRRLDNAKVPTSSEDLPTHVHPVVRVHPETGRAGLFFDPMYSTRVIELHPSESDAVLAFLRSAITDPTFACRYRWANGTFAMWDNRCTMHRVSSDFLGERIIQRVTVAGDVPVRA